MKLKILLVTSLVLVAGCNPKEKAEDPQPVANPDSQAAVSVPQKHAAPLGSEEYPSVQRGATISSAAGNMAPSLISGWSRLQPWGVYSDGTHARVGFKLDGPVTTDVQLSLRLKAFLPAAKPNLVVVPSVNGRNLPPITLTGNQTEPSSHEISIPSQDVMQAKGRIQIDFDIQDPRSPQEMGMSDDSRKLGVGLVEISVK